MRAIYTSLLIGFLAILSSTQVQAQRTFVKVGTPFSSWQLASSWNQTAGPVLGGNQYPEAGDTAIIENNARVFTIVDQSVAKVVIGNGASQLNVGNRTSSPTLTILGHLMFTGAGDRRLFLGNGKLIVEGDIRFNSNQLSILIEGRNGFSAYSREVELKGAITNLAGVPQSIGQLYELAPDPNTYTSELMLTGSGQQNLNFTATNNSNIHNNITINKASGSVDFVGTVDNNTLKGKVTVIQGEVNAGNADLTNINAMPEQLDFAPDTKLILEDNPTGAPTQSDAGNAGTVLKMDNGSALDVAVSENNTFAIAQPNPSFNVFLSDINCNGNGTKVLNGNIRPGINAFGVRNINVNRGRLQMNPSVTDISGITGIITVKSGATLRILGDPILPLADKFVLEEGSIVEYGSSNPQSVLGDIEYSNIRFTGGGTKNINTPFSFKQEMSFNNSPVVNINQDITIESDINGTGFISEIPAGVTINYNAGARFIAKRHIITAAIDFFNASENYRDYSLPLVAADATLSQFDDDNPFPLPGGFTVNDYPELPVFGIANSNYPTGNFNVSQWNSLSGLFEKFPDYNASIVKTNGFGAITSNAVRFGWADNNGQTVIARGQINRGPLTFNATFNATNNFNLFGNPYPCAISFESMFSANGNITSGGTGIDPVVYMVAPDQVGTGTLYAFYNAVTNVGTATDGIIPAYQGFFLQTKGFAPATFDFDITEAMKVEQDEVTFKSNDSGPELYNIEVKNNAGTVTFDRVHFYLFDGASNGIDPVLDVEKLEARAVKHNGATVDFVDDKKSLNLLANAISRSTNDIALRFEVKNPKNLNLTLELSNLDKLFDTFNCVFVKNTTTGEVFKVDGHFVSIPISSSTAEAQFEIASVKAPDLFQLNTADATCFGFEDGILRADLKNLPPASTVELFKNGDFFDRFTPNTEVYKRSVGAGDYEFKVAGASAECTYTFRTSVGQQPEVISDFTLPDTIAVGRDNVFKQTAQNANVYEWFTSESETLYGDSIVLRYEETGKKFLKLTSIGKFSTCRDEKLQFFFVDSVATSTVGISESGLPDFVKDLRILNRESGLELNGLESGSNASLFNLDGKMLQSNDESKGIVTFDNLSVGVYVVEVRKNQKSYRKKVAVQ